MHIAAKEAKDNAGPLRVRRSAGCEAEITIPGDKSISHRAVMFGALAEGTTLVRNFLPGEDCLSTVSCFQAMGVEVNRRNGLVVVEGRGRHGLQEPDRVLDAGNSGTTMRLLLGILAGQGFFAVLTGDASLRSRPMGRVVEPLRQMGARIWGRAGATRAPLAVQGGPLAARDFILPVASAQVKSALLLAGLHAEGRTSVTEPHKSRDHTERMLAYFGVPVEVSGLTVAVRGPVRLTAREVDVPGDISAAAFFLVAGAILPDTRLVMRGVGVNPTRTGIIDVLREMGAEIRVSNEREAGGEPVADLEVRSSRLRGVAVGGSLIPRLIDEVPVLAVAAACAEGVTEIRDAAELKVKESDRLAAVAAQLSRMGADVEALPDGLRIRGGRRLHGAACQTYGDHRMAMAMAVAGLAADGETVIDNPSCAAVSFPGFAEELGKLCRS